MYIPFKKKILFTITVIIIFQIIFIVTLEISLRLYMHIRYGVPGKKYGIYIADKELGAVHRPNSYNRNTVINNRGFRNIEDISEQKPEGAMRIYCSGGSTTFCYNLATEESWPNLLQYKVRQIPGHELDEALNAGQICFAISHEFALAKRLIPVLKPDIVILYGLGTNEGLALGMLKYDEGKDFKRLLAEKKWGIFPRKLDQARFLKRNSMLIKFYDYKISLWLEEHLIKQFRKRFVLDRDLYAQQWMFENFDNTLRAYLAFLYDNGCKVVIVRHSDNGIENPYFTGTIKVLRDRAVNIGREKGAIIVDFATIVEQHPKRKDLYIDSGLHITRDGSELLSDVLLDTLIKNDKT